MLNWIKFIIAFLVVLTSIISVTVFVNAGKPFSEAKEKAAETVIKSGQLKTVVSTEVFNGTQSSITVFGVDEDGKEKAVFFNEEVKEGFKEVFLSEGITKEKALQNVEKEFKVKKVLHVSLGMEEEEPVWEVAFKNVDGNLNYVYLYFENGKWWKRILNL